MKIAIIGAGWVGCHLAKTLMPADLTLFDERGIFEGTSFRNQNRLHLGFHYARNYQTRRLCQTTFNRFVNEYSNLVKAIDSNVYAVPNHFSNIDFRTYLSIFDYEGIEYSGVNCESLVDIEGSIKNSEMLIDYREAREYFTRLHSQKLSIKRIDSSNILDLLLQYDFVINCTNNAIKEDLIQAYHELSLTLLYRKTNQIEFDALTLVDGNFFSLFPYRDDLYTLTSVKHTPIYISNNPEAVIEQEDSLSKKDIEPLQTSFAGEVLAYYPDFLRNFEYESFFTSIKAKTINSSANRYPIVKFHDRLINCFTGKIQGIFMIEESIKKYINEYEGFNR